MEPFSPINDGESIVSTNKSVDSINLAGIDDEIVDSSNQISPVSSSSEFESTLPEVITKDKEPQVINLTLEESKNTETSIPNTSASINQIEVKIDSEKIVDAIQNEITNNSVNVTTNSPVNELSERSEVSINSTVENYFDQSIKNEEQMIQTFNTINSELQNISNEYKQSSSLISQLIKEGSLNTKFDVSNNTINEVNRENLNTVNESNLSNNSTLNVSNTQINESSDFTKIENSSNLDKESSFYSETKSFSEKENNSVSNNLDVEKTTQLLPPEMAPITGSQQTVVVTPESKKEDNSFTSTASELEKTEAPIKSTEVIQSSGNNTSDDNKKQAPIIIDTTELANRMARIERLLSGPLEVKIVH